MITDNNFLFDSYDERLARLYKVQHFFVNHPDSLELPASVAEWVVDCNDVFNDFRTNYRLATIDKKYSSINVTKEVAKMGSLYQIARQLALATYNSDTDGISDLGIDVKYPTIRSEKMERVETLLKATARHITQGKEYALPTNLTTKLQNALADVKSALEKQAEETANYRVQLTAIRSKMESDLVILRIILALWQAEKGKNDDSIESLGMVNPSEIKGRGTPPPVADITFDSPETLTWTASEKATSYQVQASDDGKTWETIIATEENSVTVDGTIGKMYRVRARNVNGFGKFAAAVTVVEEENVE